jgi:ankyrin repeat protein
MFHIHTTDGFTPLLNAAWRGETTLVKLLLRYGANAQASGVSLNVGPMSAVQWAEHQGHTDTAKVLHSHAKAQSKAAGVHSDTDSGAARRKAAAAAVEVG